MWRYICVHTLNTCIFYGRLVNKWYILCTYCQQKVHFVYILSTKGCILCTYCQQMVHFVYILSTKGTFCVHIVNKRCIVYNTVKNSVWSQIPFVNNCSNIIKISFVRTVGNIFNSYFLGSFIPWLSPCLDEKKKATKEKIGGMKLMSE